MCKECGCSGEHHEHHHDHGTGEHVHYRPDGTAYTHRHDGSAPREVRLGEAVLAANDRLAEENRAWFRKHGVRVLNLISSPGAGKTELLTKTLPELVKRGIPTAVIVGDQCGTLDAARMRCDRVKVTQIETHSSCHLDAARIHAVLEEAVPEGTKLLLIENVGNLVCPAAFDLGEEAKVALLSTPEGEEKPYKYPALFAAAKAVVLTKMDLAETLGWDEKRCLGYLRQVGPEAQVLRVSAKTGAGMADFLKMLSDFVNQSK